MKKVVKYICYIFLGLAVVNCDDIFEEDISDDIITILSPRNNDTIIGNSVSFNWNSIDGADNYKIEVTRFDTFESIIDSTLSDNSLTIPLDSGSYEWRVRGENFAYNSNFSLPESFIVESTNDLSSQNVFLNSPSDNFFTRNNTVILNWSNLEAADSYSIQIEQTIATNTSVVFQDNTILGTSYTLDATILSEDAIYRWSIKGENSNSETSFSTRTILLDTMVPNQPTLISPNDNTLVATTVDFSWEIGQDIGNVQSSIENLLEISTEDNFSSLVESYLIGGVAQQHTFTTTGDFYWRVKSIDSAGNESLYSDTRIISVE
jgi:hypothetical protein